MKQEGVSAAAAVICDVWWLVVVVLTAAAHLLIFLISLGLFPLHQMSVIICFDCVFKCNIVQLKCSLIINPVIHVLSA